MSFFTDFLTTAEKEFNTFLSKINEADYDKAAEIILSAVRIGNRLHVTGIGKPGHIAGYGASLISSTGTPAYFLHGTEAVHGSCGQLEEGDVVICISNSGETVEMQATAAAIRNNGCKIIAVTGNPDSWLSKFSDFHIYAGVEEEGGPLNRAPKTSILAETFVLQALAVKLQETRLLTPQEYIRRHPGGSLGKLRDDEK